MSASDLPDVGDREAVARTLHSKMNAHVLMVCGEVGKLWDELQEETRETWMAVSESVQRLVADAVAKANTTLDALRAERDALALKANPPRSPVNVCRHCATTVWTTDERQAGPDGVFVHPKCALRAERDTATRRAEEAIGLLRSARGHVDCSIYDIEHDNSESASARYPVLHEARALLSKIDAFLRSTDAGGKSLQIVPPGMECGCCGAKAGSAHVADSCCSRHKDGPRLYRSIDPKETTHG